MEVIMTQQQQESAQFDFDPTAQSGLSSREAMPTHWASVFVESSKMKATGGGTGAALELTCLLMPGQEFAGRKIWINLNVQNANEKAVEIAKAELTTISTCAGVLERFNNTSVLHNKPFDIHIEFVPEEHYIDPQTGQPQMDSTGTMPLVKWKAKNEVKDYAAFGKKVTLGANTQSVGQPVAAVAQAAPVQQAPAQAAPVQAVAQAAPVQQVTQAAPVQQAASIPNVQQAAPAQVQVTASQPGTVADGSSPSGSNVQGAAVNPVAAAQAAANAQLQQSAAQPLAQEAPQQNGADAPSWAQ